MTHYKFYDESQVWEMAGSHDKRQEYVEDLYDLYFEGKEYPTLREQKQILGFATYALGMLLWDLEPLDTIEEIKEELNYED